MCWINEDTEIHQNWSRRGDTNYMVFHFILVDDICVLSVLLSKWKKFLPIPCKTNENGSKSWVFPPWATLNCFNKECEHQFIDVFLYPPSDFCIYSLLIFFFFLTLFTTSQYCVGSKPKLQERCNHTHGQGRGKVAALITGPLAFPHTPSLSRISKLWFLEFASLNQNKCLYFLPNHFL